MSDHSDSGVRTPLRSGPRERLPSSQGRDTRLHRAISVGPDRDEKPAIAENAPIETINVKRMYMVVLYCQHDAAKATISAYHDHWRSERSPNAPAQGPAYNDRSVAVRWCLR